MGIKRSNNSGYRPGNKKQMMGAMAGAIAGAVVDNVARGVGKAVGERIGNIGATKGNQSEMVESKNFNVSKIYQGKTRKLSKKTMKKKKRKAQWQEKVRKATLMDNGTKAFCLQHYTTTTPIGIDNFQASISFCFYGNIPTTSITAGQRNGYTDLDQLRQQDPASLSSQRYTIMSMHSRIQILSTGTVPAIIDMYRITNRQTRKAESINITAIQAGYLNNNTDTIGSTAAGVTKIASLNDIHYTPFMNAQFCRNYKVLSKQTMTLAPGDNIIFEERNKIPFHYDGTVHTPATEDFLKPTYFLEFLYRGIQNEALYAQQGAGISVLVNTTYKYKREDIAADGGAEYANIKLTNP